MPYNWHLKSIYIYFILLFISITTTISGLSFFLNLNIISYIFLHILLIYLGIYYNRNLLLFVFFIAGITLDVTLLNEIGPHMISFIIVIFCLDKMSKVLVNFNSFKMLCFIIFSLIVILSFEKIFIYVFYNYSFDFFSYVQLILLSLITLIPSFFLFQKIDNLEK